MKDKKEVAISFSVIKGINMQQAIGQACWDRVKDKEGSRVTVYYKVREGGIMRSIGGKNVSLVKRLTKEAIEKRMPYVEMANYNSVEDEVVDQLPDKLWDTWEAADSQIRMIINDTIMED